MYARSDAYSSISLQVENMALPLLNRYEMVHYVNQFFWPSTLDTTRNLWFKLRRQQAIFATSNFYSIPFSLAITFLKRAGSQKAFLSDGFSLENRLFTAC
jgi:hypothetical protein